ncbi:MAG: cob(I)yrinic acid a,c-diamide adenosyltransferase [Chloroflexaceae bacterium]|jgi:cob(I)alamin adenosyltransferase|nr:cob(I)yrinic acid a,c-diamide adenosyltransferase [Chloroflexaceae bacterium]
MKIYTKTGDKGETGLWGGLRVPKDSLRVQAYGTVDECNAALGVARASGLDGGLDGLLAKVQDQLFVVGSDLATPGESANIPRVGAEEVTFLEQTIDALERELEPLRQFILPGGTPAAAHLHLARTVCRRAERWTVTLGREEPINEQVSVYLNRLSDMLFVLARAANARAGVDDVPWNSPRMGG